MTNEIKGEKLKFLARPHNCYNIYFILERERLIQERKETSVEKDGIVSKGKQKTAYDLAGYDSLSLPDLPLRYKGLSLENGWWVPGKNADRKHVKTHGLTSFADLARTVATNWKVVDDDTKEYCKAVAHIIKERHAKLTLTEGYRPKKKSRERTKMGISKKSMKMQPKRSTSMPITESSTLSGEDFQRSASMSDISSPGVNFITIIAPSSYPFVTPELAIYSHRDIANRILQLNHVNMLRRSSLPDLPIAFTNPGLNLPICPSNQECTEPKRNHNKTSQDMNIISRCDIINKERSSSLPNLSTFIPSKDLDLPIICTTIRDDITTKCHGRKSVEEVDISDSAIHDMWMSTIV